MTSFMNEPKLPHEKLKRIRIKDSILPPYFLLCSTTRKTKHIHDIIFALAHIKFCRKNLHGKVTAYNKTNVGDFDNTLNDVLRIKQYQRYNTLLD